MRFKAFISYNRARDGPTAEALEGALEHTARKWYQRRAFRVCLDVSDLPASSGLRTSIETHLAESEFMILLARPESAHAQWVCTELEWWRANRTIDKLIIVRTGGTIRWLHAAKDFDWAVTTALPRCLSGAFIEEPAYVDLPVVERGQNAPDWTQPLFRRALLKIAEPLHGRPADELDGEDLRQGRRFRRAVALVVVTFVALIAIAAVYRFRSRVESVHNEAKRLARIVRDSTTDPKRSVLVGLAAVGATYSVDGTVTPEAQEALNWAIQLDEGIVNFDRAWLPRSASRMVTADGRALVSSDGNAINVFDLRTQHETIIPAGVAPLAALAFADASVVALDDHLTVFRWSLDGRPREVTPLSAKAPARLALSADGRTVAWSDSNRVLFVAKQGADRPRRVDCGNGDGDLSLSADGALLLIATASSVVVCDVQRGSSIMLATGAVGPVELAPRGDQLATASGYQLQLWTLTTAQADSGASLTGHLGRIDALAFSSDGTRLASGDTDGTVRLWNTASKAMELELRRPSHMIESITFSVDGRYIAVLSNESLTMYPTTVDELIAEAHRHAGSRRLTTDECRQILGLSTCPVLP